MTRLIHLNGVSIHRGALPPIPVEQLAARLVDKHRPAQVSAEERAELQLRNARNAPHFGVEEGVDATKLDEAGWGLIWPSVAKGSAVDRQHDAIREALLPLIRLRREQAGARFKEFRHEGGYQPSQPVRRFLADHDVGSGPAVPDKVPYYLLLIGTPEELPFRFQCQLDVQYGVGRICFDTLDEYDRYARSVVAAERGELRRARKAAFFATAHPDDEATRQSATHLVRPLADWFEGDQQDQATRGHGGWTSECIVGEAATKARLGRLMGGDDSPALLFTAAHGLDDFEPGERGQTQLQGALVTQDWRGPEHDVSPEVYFSAGDLDENARLQGMIAFLFGCFSAATPKHSHYSFELQRGAREALAPRPFMAALPTKLLSHRSGGALAVVGHVERAWPTAFLLVPGMEEEVPKEVPQRVVFQSALKRLAQGCPIGWAMEYFNDRYAAVTAELAAELDNVNWGVEPDPIALVQMWLESSDMRDYVIIGDPAVRLSLAEPDGTSVLEAPVLAPSTVSATAAHAEIARASSADSARPALDPPRSAATPAPMSVSTARPPSTATAPSLDLREVRTYLCEDLGAVSTREGDASPGDAAELRAMSRIGQDGVLETFLPRGADSDDAAVRELHAAALAALLSSREGGERGD